MRTYMMRTLSVVPEVLGSVSGLGSNVTGVDVRTTGANGNDANKPFHLLVLC